jgi:hypothetical protein
MNVIYAPAQPILSAIGLHGRFYLLAGLVAALAAVTVIEASGLRWTLGAIIAAATVYLLLAILDSTQRPVCSIAKRKNLKPRWRHFT